MRHLPQDGKIIVRWDKFENDILYLWGAGVPRCDTSLVNSALSYDFHRKDNDIYHGLIQELEKRGYDLTTFRMEIKKKPSTKQKSTEVQHGN